METVKEILRFLGNTHTPKHIPAGLYIFAALLIMWFIVRRRMTFGDLCGALGILGVGAGAVIWAVRWKPGTVVNNNTVVNHTVVQHSGLAVWQEILIAVVLAVLAAVVIRIFWMVVAGRWHR